MTPALRALPFVVVMTAVSTYAFARQLTCYAIRPGDTAASLAQRLTGNGDNRHQAWFQIVNPTTATFIPKSHYDAIQSGWHVCVTTAMLRPGSAQPRYQLISSTPLLLPRTSVTQQPTAIDVSVLWWVMPLFVVVSGLVLRWYFSGRHAGERRARLDTMKGFGDRFISEFERPLVRTSAAESPVRSRLRVAPARHELEVLLAPADGRTYPNLVDHRKNVEYDVERVLRLLGDEPFINDPLYAEGPWVVIPFHFDTGRQQEGVS